MAVEDRGKRKEILGASVELLKQLSLTKWSIDGCARKARCAKGLVIHYFGGRESLLAASAEELARLRASAWSEAVSSGGVSGLDRLWDRLVAEATDGHGRALLELRLAGVAGATLPADEAARLAGALAAALEIPPDRLPAPAVLEPIIEGFLLALHRHVDSASARESFFRYWLSYVE